MGDAPVPAAGRTRVLIISQDAVGPKMAGPGLRYWELARVLAGTCDVTLAAPLSGDTIAGGWALRPITLRDADEVTPLVTNCDVVISSGMLLHNYPHLADLSVPWVVDAYIPTPIESLVHYVGRPMPDQAAIHAANVAVFNRALTRADLVLCANERQRDLYLGMLASQGRVHPVTYAHDATLQCLVEIVPFGLPARQPVLRRPVLKGVAPGVTATDKVVLWGGGIWDWLDPLTLLQAMPVVLREHPNARVFFPGARHPDHARVPDTAMHVRAVQLCERLGLLRHVFFGEWVPHAERESYLVEADIGVSLHPAGAEARYAWRTRVLDYIWAGLPMVLSRGDSLAELAACERLGLVVEPGDVQGVAKALLTLLGEQDARRDRRERFARAAKRFQWDRVAAPLVHFCRHPRCAIDKAYSHGRPETSSAVSEIGGQLKRNSGGGLAAASARIAELETLLAAYEGGRFMRAMAMLKRWGRRLSNKGGGA